MSAAVFHPKSPVRILLVACLLLLGTSAARAVMLVELALNATARPYGPGAGVQELQQEFSVPGGPGQVIVTYTEETYVGGPGGFWFEPKDLSNERLGFGGATTYTPRDPAKGQRYVVRTTYAHSFSKKVWVAKLTARHEYQAYQVRNRGRQHAGVLRLTIEFVPGGAQPQTPAQPGPTQPAPATPAPTQPAPQPPAATPPPVVTPPVAPPVVIAPPPPPPIVPPRGGLPAGRDSFDSISILRGDPFDGGEWSNARNGSAWARRELAAPACVSGLVLGSAGSDVSTQGASIVVTLTAADGRRHTVFDLRDAAIARDFSPGGTGRIEGAQQVSFLPMRIVAVEVTMSGHGWFRLAGLRFTPAVCP